jgi:hypothetical protein
MPHTNPPIASDVTPDSTPNGPGKPDAVAAYGQSAEGNFYDNRDDLAGGTDSEFNQGRAGLMGGADWASAGDTAESFNSGSGLGGDRTRFSDVLSAAASPAEGGLSAQGDRERRRARVTGLAGSRLPRHVD